MSGSVVPHRTGRIGQCHPAEVGMVEVVHDPGVDDLGIDEHVVH